MAEFPEAGASGRVVRIAAVGDFHCKGHGEEAELSTLFAGVGAEADVLLLLGDMTTHGEPDQARTFASYLKGVDIPMVGVLGNHDHETDQTDALCSILSDAGVRMLDGEAVEIEGVGFAGTKGFGGGFGRHALATFGERESKAYVEAALQEELKLERALAELRSGTKVVLLHYSPVADTLGDEPREIWPFLGSSRLLNPIETYDADVVFHGHAHTGSPEGATPNGIPVYNVAWPVLRKHGLDYRIWSTPALDRRAGADVPAGSS